MRSPSTGAIDSVQRCALNQNMHAAATDNDREHVTPYTPSACSFTHPHMGRRRLRCVQHMLGRYVLTELISASLGALTHSDISPSHTCAASRVQWRDAVIIARLVWECPAAELVSWVSVLVATGNPQALVAERAHWHEARALAHATRTRKRCSASTGRTEHSLPGLHVTRWGSAG